MTTYISFRDLAKNAPLDNTDAQIKLDRIPSANEAIGVLRETGDSPSLEGRVSVASSTASPLSSSAPSPMNYAEDLERELAIGEILSIAETDLSEAEFKQIEKYIVENRATHAGNTVYCHSKEVGLPRSLSFYPDGTVYIHLNQVKGDDDHLIGRGLSKKAKYSINFDTNEICARTTASGTCTKEVEFFDLTKDISGVVRLYHSQTFKSSKNGVEKTEMIMPFYSNGTLNSLEAKLAVNPDVECEDIVNPDEVKRNFAEALEQTIKQLHEAGVSHGDLHAGNIFLTEAGETIIADFGYANKDSSDINKVKDLFYLHTLFSSVLHTDEPAKADEMKEIIKTEIARISFLEKPTQTHLHDTVSLYNLVTKLYSASHEFYDLTYELMVNYEGKFEGEGLSRSVSPNYEQAKMRTGNLDMDYSDSAFLGVDRPRLSKSGYSTAEEEVV